MINISGGRDLTLSEVYEAVDLVRDVAHADCNVIFGANVNNDVSGETEVTVIATGFEHKDEEKKESVPEFKDNSADFKAFTYSPIEKLSIEDVMPEEEKVEEKPVKEEKFEEPEHNDEVEDISIASKKPIIDDDDIPPFLRKLRR